MVGEDHIHETGTYDVYVSLLSQGRLFAYTILGGLRHVLLRFRHFIYGYRFRIS